MDSKNTAIRILKQAMGSEYEAPEVVKFLADRLDEGESIFSLSQFLRTTPAYLKRFKK